MHLESGALPGDLSSLSLSPEPPRGYSFTRYAIPIALVLLIHFALRMMYSESVEPDDADLIIYSQQLAWGYSDQGPLYSWLAEGFFQVFGVNVLAITALRVAILAAAMWWLYRIARLLCRDYQIAIFGSYAVLLIPNLSWHALAYLTHTNLMVVTCLATLFCFLRMVRDGRTRDYLLFGVACASGVLSKFNFVWFAASLLVAGVTFTPFRKRLLDVRILLAGIVCAGLVLPHAIWILENRETLAEVLRKKAIRSETAHAGYLTRVLRGTRDAAVSGFLMAAPLFAVVSCVFRRPKSRSAEPSFQNLAQKFLGWFFLVAIALIFVQIYGLGMSRFHERWLQPFMVVFPVWLFSRLEPQQFTRGRVRIFASLIMVLVLGYTATRIVQVAWLLDVPRGSYPMRMNFDPLVHEIEKEVGDQPNIVSPEREVAGNILLKMPKARVNCTGQPLYPQPLRDGPIVIAWNIELTHGIPVPPWLTIEQYKGEPWFLKPIPPESVRVIEVARPVPGKPVARIAYVVVKR